MPEQEGEPPFADGEPLYRRLVQDWIQGDGSVDPGAIEFPYFSVDRGSLTTDREALARGKPSEVAVAEVPFGKLPHYFPAESVASRDQPKDYRTVVVYAPEATNSSHTHVEFRRAGEAKASKPGSIMKVKIREAVAAAMTVTLKRSP